MKRYLLTSGAVVCLSLAACSGHHRMIGKRDLMKYLNDPGHELVQRDETKGLQTTLSFEPGSLLVGQELTGSGKRDSATIRELEEKYSKNYYFLLKFSRDNKEPIRQMGSFSQYSDMVQVLSFQMQQFVNLTTTTHDTIPLSDYTFEQTYGMGNANTLLLAFSRDKLDKADLLDVNIAECGFGVGSMKFSFRKKDLEKVPGLDYNKLD